jgi:ATP-dependent Clp protease ATP-binding subunit ClpA
MIKKSPFAVVVTAALDEARRRGDRRLGTEHLFLGLLHAPDSLPAKALGVDLDTTRAALDALDHAALAAIGLDVEELRAGLVPRKHPPVTLSALSSNARAILDHAVKATTVRTRRTAPDHLLRALLTCEQPDPVAQLLAQLNIDRSVVRSRLDEFGT